MKNQKRESDGRFVLTLSSKRSYSNFLKREQEREAARNRNYNDAIACGLSLERAKEEMFLFA
jgi:hypothetical protein